MKFTVDQEVIKDVLKKMSKLLNGKSSIPIYSGVLVQTREDCILFTGSDGTESMIHRVPVADGIAVVDAVGSSVFLKDCLEVAKKLKGLITFEVTNTSLMITQDKTELSYGVLEASDYPKVAVEPNSEPIVFTGQEFKELVNKTAFAASTSEVRPILTGINMKFTPEGNVFVATDSHRLGKMQFGESKKELNITVPSGTLEYALKSFDLSNEVLVFPSELQIAFANGNTILYTRLIEGNFPDTSRLIPTQSEFSLVLSRQELLDSLDLLATMTKNSVVKLSAGTLFIKLSAKGDTSKGSKEIAFESYDGEEGFDIAFSAKYVSDALQAMTSSSIKIQFNGAMKPFVIEPVGETPKELQLILPVRAA